MKVLFITSPGFGHNFPVVSMAWALRAAGHDVVLGSAGAIPTHLPSLANSGLPVVELATVAQMTEVYRTGTADVGLGGFSDKELRAMARLGAESPNHEVDKPFGALSAVMADGAVEFGQWWRPDLVVHSRLQGAGPLVAAKLGVPAVEHSHGLTSSRDIAVKLAAELDDAYRRHGVAGFPERHELLNIAPPSMVVSDRGWPMRHVPYHGGIVLPEWLLRTPDRPRITITMGSILPVLWPRLRPLRWIVDVAADVDAEFVLALAGVDASVLGPLPANVRSVAGWLPVDALAATTHAMIHHGGSGSMMAALAAGVPQLVIPFLGDQFGNARAVVRRGVGIEIDIDRERVTAATVRRLVDDESLQTAAAEVRAEVAAMPSPADLVPRLVALAQSR
jgi:UDP:flavonoid glycosyltransferase YjiC (YdhE family)